MSNLRRLARGVSEALPDRLLHITDITLAQPWGRIVPIRAELEKGIMSEVEGGTGIGKKFWRGAKSKSSRICRWISGVFTGILARYDMPGLVV
jgi:hypothetical protein